MGRGGALKPCVTSSWFSLFLHALYFYSQSLAQRLRGHACLLPLPPRVRARSAVLTAGHLAAGRKIKVRLAARQRHLPTRGEVRPSV
jgi:hypothetical protein